MLIQGPDGFWCQGACLAFSVPNLVIASLLFISMCLPQVSFKDWYGLLLGVAGPSMLDSNVGMD